MGSAKPSPSASTTTSTRRVRQRAHVTALIAAGLTLASSPAFARSCTVAWSDFLGHLTASGGAVELWGIRQDGVLTVVPTREANCQIDVTAGRVSTSEGRDCRMLVGRTLNLQAGWRVTSIEATGTNWLYEPLATGGFAFRLVAGLPPPYSASVTNVTLTGPSSGNCDDKRLGWRTAF